MSTYIDLFAGCGGFSLGLDKAGFKCKWAIELDEDAVETYKNNLNHNIICDDINNVCINTVPKTDVIVGGFPCQPFSLSGLQQGFGGKSGDLFFQCCRFIKNIQPKVFVLENVAGFKRLKNGYYLEKALEELSKLGYIVDWEILNSSSFEIPQSRERLFIIGNNQGRKNIFPQTVGRIVSVKEAIDDIRFNMDAFCNNEPMRHTERIKKRFAAVREGESARDAMDRDPSLGNAKITKQCYRRMYADKPAPTIVANFVTTTIHYAENRNLTAREAARIQTFPDSFIFKGRKTRMSWQKGLSQFEQIGNAVPPKLAQLIGLSVKKILKHETPIEDNPRDFREKQQTFTEILNLGSSGSFPQNKRGRKSKYEKIYKQIEEKVSGDEITLPSDISDEFFIFLDGAMRRRNIKFQIIQGVSKKVKLI